MIIDIEDKRTIHGWVVRMDALAVNFNSLEEANAFVGQLKARIDAPHSWPNTAGQRAFRTPDLGGRCTPVNETNVRADLVTQSSGAAVQAEYGLNE
jgi:hypothetical protein